MFPTSFRKPPRRSPKSGSHVESLPCVRVTGGWNRSARWSAPSLLVALVAIATTGCERKSDQTPPDRGGESGQAAPADDPIVAAPRPSRFALVPRPDQAPYEDDSRIDIARRMLDARDYRMAEQVMRTVLLQNGNVDRARFYLALATHKQKRYAQARPIFERVLETRQGFPEVDHVFHFYGWCLYNLGELDAARGAFEEHLRRVPTEGDSVYGLGLIALEEDRLDDAEASFRRAIELQIDLPSRRIDVAKAHARLGDVQLRRNEVEAARGSYTEAVRLWPDHYEVWAKLSRVHARLGNETAAESALAEHDAAKRRVGRAPASEAAEDASNEERDEPAVDDSAPPG